MKFLPIMEELFSSDSVIFLLIGLIIAVVVGIGLKEIKKITIGIIASFIIYAACEIVSNVPVTFLLELFALFIGTVSIGCVIGFLIAMIVSKIRNR